VIQTKKWGACWICVAREVCVLQKTTLSVCWERDESSGCTDHSEAKPCGGIHSMFRLRSAGWIPPPSPRGVSRWGVDAGCVCLIWWRIRQNCSTICIITISWSDTLVSIVKSTVTIQEGIRHPTARTGERLPPDIVDRSIHLRRPSTSPDRRRTSTKTWLQKGYIVAGRYLCPHVKAGMPKTNRERSETILHQNTTHKIVHHVQSKKLIPAWANDG